MKCYDYHLLGNYYNTAIHYLGASNNLVERMDFMCVSVSSQFVSNNVIVVYTPKFAICV